MPAISMHTGYTGLTLESNISTGTPVYLYRNVEGLCFLKMDTNKYTPRIIKINPTTAYGPPITMSMVIMFHNKAME